MKEGNVASMWRLNCTTVQQLQQGIQKSFCWEQISTTGKDLGKISHHSCAMVSAKEIAFFGGLQGESSNTQIALLNLLKNQWSSLSIKVRLDRPRLTAPCRRPLRTLEGTTSLFATSRTDHSALLAVTLMVPVSTTSLSSSMKALTVPLTCWPVRKRECAGPRSAPPSRPESTTRRCMCLAARRTTTRSLTTCGASTCRPASGAKSTNLAASTSRLPVVATHQ